MLTQPKSNKLAVLRQPVRNISHSAYTISCQDWSSPACDACARAGMLSNVPLCLQQRAAAPTLDRFKVYGTVRCSSGMNHADPRAACAVTSYCNMTNKSVSVASEMYTSLKSFRDLGDPDVVLQLDDGSQLPAHNEVLVSLSSVFRNVLRSTNDKQVGVVGCG